MIGPAQQRAALLALAMLVIPRAARGDAVAVSPGDLARRADLVGREVEVDDRLAYFQFHRGHGFDEVVLKRAGDVAFRLPGRLRPPQPPRASAVKVRGILKRDGDRLVVDVEAMELLPDDLDRLETAVARLAPTDFTTRANWARWAEARGEAFLDETLKARALALEVEAIRIEADRAGVVDRASHWLALADRAKARRLPEPEPSAIAHRGLRAKLAGAKSAADLAEIPPRVEALLPDSRAVPPGPTPSPPPSADPAAEYRAASPAGRKALDRALRVDAIQAELERRADEAPASALTLADRARDQIPDRPEVAERLRERGLATATADLGALSQAEVTALAGRFRDDLKAPDRALDLLTRWLRHRRQHRLGKTDAEGRVLLAAQFIALIADRRTAVDLLREALEIDPQSKEAADAFRRLGYRKVDGGWTEPGAAIAEGDAAARPAGPEASAEALVAREMTRDQVRSRLGGKPDRVVRVATQGEVVEQWIYSGTRGTQVINFRTRAGQLQPTVWNYYSIR